MSGPILSASLNVIFSKILISHHEIKKRLVPVSQADEFKEEPANNILDTNFDYDEMDENLSIKMKFITYK